MQQRSRRRATRAQGPAAGEVGSTAPQQTETAEEPQSTAAPTASPAPTAAPAPAPAPVEETAKIERPSLVKASTATTADSTPAASTPADSATAAPAGAGPDLPPSRPRVRTLVGAGGALLLVLALAAATVLLLRATTSAEDDARREAFVQTARQGVLNLTNIRHQTAAEDVQNLLDGSSGTFAEEFGAGKDSYIQVVQQAQVDSAGTIEASALERLDDNTGVVLVASSAKVSNSSSPQPEDRSYRLRVTVVDDGGRMTVSKVDFVP
ncbi:hypothetical protein [Rhodococcus sp. X156]|uniref:hypothetical protein n=1 Tax=Rhodococcus sp. X156 TaxID=2499145 RepID=UPI000FDADD63|nr:hypothetical protein [Rhodococcus sp. X156]